MPAEAAKGRPVVSVGAVIVRQGQVVLVQRAYPPLQGGWSLPGGRVELGETLGHAVAREVLEETGLEVSVGPVLDVLDRIDRDEEGQIAFHYVIIDYLCRVTGGRLAHGSDAADARWVHPSEFAALDVTTTAAAVLNRGLAWEHAGGRRPDLGEAFVRMSPLND